MEGTHYTHESPPRRYKSHKKHPRKRKFKIDAESTLEAYQNKKRKQAQNQIEQPMTYVNPKVLQEKLNDEIRSHSSYVRKVLEKHTLYTSAKIIPGALHTEHTIQVRTFKRNFICREHTHRSGGAGGSSMKGRGAADRGYFSEGEQQLGPRDFKK